MKYLAGTFIVLSSLLLMVVSCSDVADVTGPDDKRIGRNPLIDDPVPRPDPIQVHLEERWNLYDQADKVRLSAEIDPDLGGAIIGAPPTWPSELVWEVHFQPGFMDVLKSGADKSTIEFQLVVSEYDASNPMSASFELLPHGLEFGNDVVIKACLPPCELVCDPTDHYHYCTYYYDRSAQTPYTYSYKDVAVAQGSYQNPCMGIEIRTRHTSRWDLENGKGGDGTLDPVYMPCDPTFPIPIP